MRDRSAWQPAKRETLRPSGFCLWRIPYLYNISFIATRRWAHMTRLLPPPHRQLSLACGSRAYAPALRRLAGYASTSSLMPILLRTHVGCRLQPATAALRLSVCFSSRSYTVLNHLRLPRLLCATVRTCTPF